MRAGRKQNGIRLLLPFLCLTFLSWVQRADTAQRATVDAVCRLVCVETDVRDQYGNPRIGQGTANVIYSGNGFSLLVTNAHCIPRGGRGKILLACPHIAKRGKRPKIEVIACKRDTLHNPGLELALLKVDIELPFYIPVAPKGYKLPQRATSVGYDGVGQGSKGQPQRFRLANVRIWKQGQDWHRIYTSAPTRPGHSGGALITPDGYLIGTNIGVIGEARRIGYYTSLQAIHALLGKKYYDLCCSRGHTKAPEKKRPTIQPPRTIDSWELQGLREPQATLQLPLQCPT